MANFNSFQSLCLNILAQSDNCIESQEAFRAASNITEMTFAWKRFWAGIVREVPTQVLQAFEEFYPEYKEELNRAGIYYNNHVAMLSRNDVMLVGDETHSIDVFGHGKVYVLGKATVTAHDDVTVYCNNTAAKISIYGNVHALMTGGTCEAHDSSSVTGKGTFVTHGNSTVFITAGNVIDHGHAMIDAYGDSTVETFTHKDIKLSGKAKILFRE